jgi:succinate dehydrogenase (ubiquinone) membrane anchor subunit
LNVIPSSAQQQQPPPPPGTKHGIVAGPAATTIGISLARDYDSHDSHNRVPACLSTTPTTTDDNPRRKHTTTTTTTTTTTAMASLVRPTLLRQLAAAGARPRIAVAPVASAVLPSKPFTTTPRRALLPPPSQVIKGGVNDPVPVPPPSPTHGSYHWTFERLLAAGLVPLTVAPFAAGSLNPALDASLCAILILHSHMGFQACIIDYIPKKRFPRSHKAFMWALNGATVLAAVGLYEFETNDVGVTEAVKRVWKA